MNKYFVLAVCLSLIPVIMTESKRPFWIIAHMVNNRQQIDEFLDEGANALEADVTYDSSGTPLYFFHGLPCDLFRVCTYKDEIGPYLETIRERTTPGDVKYNPNLALIEFDNKLGDVDAENLETAGSLFAGKVIKLFDSASKIKVLLSVPKLSQKKFFLGFRKAVLETKQEQLMDTFGYEFSEEKETPLEDVHSAFKEVGINAPYIWLSNGAFNGYIFDIDFHHLLPYRDEPDKRFASKVYGWTADKYNTLGEWIEHGLDAIITNKPAVLYKALQGFWETHRLATNDDNPFYWIKTPVDPAPFYTWCGCSYQPLWFYNYCWKTCANGSWCWIDAYCGGHHEVCYKERPCYDDDQEKSVNRFVYARE